MDVLNRITRRGWRRPTAALTAASVAALTSFVGVAAAHFVYESGDYVRGPICVLGGSGIAEGPNAGGGQAIAEVWTESFGQGFCLTAKNFPAYYQALRRELWRWNPSVGEWRLCATNGWTYNSTASSYRADSKSWTPMPCGAGWYNHLGAGYAFYDGQWLGGARWAGNHYF
jgi:hypothetical protein